jgi:hypothetical protein
MPKAKPAPARRNLVAKHARQFQRAASFRDRSKYERHDKHKGREPFPQPVAKSSLRKGLNLAA